MFLIDIMDICKLKLFSFVDSFSVWYGKRQLNGQLVIPALRKFTTKALKYREQVIRMLKPVEELQL